MARRGAIEQFSAHARPGHRPPARLKSSAATATLAGPQCCITASEFGSNYSSGAVMPSERAQLLELARELAKPKLKAKARVALAERMQRLLVPGESTSAGKGHKRA